MKVLTIPSCKQCPYCQFNRELETYECAKFGFELGSRPSDIGWPADCKLNDLPDDDEIEKSISRDAIGHEPTFYRKGANFIIERIKK